MVKQTGKPPQRAGPFFVGPKTGKAGSILFHDERPVWVYLNPPAREAFTLRGEGMSAAGIARRLAARYSLPPGTAEADVRAVLRDLDRRGFKTTPSKPVRRKPVLKSLHIHVTERCNLACAHCHFAASPRRTLDMPVEKVLDLIGQAADLGASSLNISGGEPLIHPDIKKILRYGARRMVLRLVTNGTLIDADWAAFLASIGAYVQISLDGPDAPTHDAVRGSGSFTRAVRAVRHLRKAGLADRLTLSTTIQDANIDRLRDITALARRLGVPSLRFLPLRRAGRAARNWGRVGAKGDTAAYERFYDEVHSYRERGRPGPSLDISCGLSGFVPFSEGRTGDDDFWCFVGTMLAIAADGKAYPCVLMMRKEFLLGDAHRRPLSRIVRSRPMVRACGILSDRRRDIPECAACLWRNLCQGGCMGLALDQKGSVLATDRFCAYRKKKFRAAFDKILDHAAARCTAHAG